MKRTSGGAFLLAIAIALLGDRGASAQNVLANPGFETNAVLNAAPVPGATGWSVFGNASTASANLDPVHGGIGSLRLAGGGNFSVPGGFQAFPASAGQVWDFQGFMLTNNALPANATFGLLKIVWGNGTMDLPPAAITFGTAAPAANPGIESAPTLNSTSALGAWQFTRAQGVAPAGTTTVTFFALFVDQSAGTGYFDDLVATNVPEPSSLALGGLVMCAGIGRRRRVLQRRD
jgi:hypothetical protein